MSLDSVSDQARFHEREKLNFPLLSDPDGSAARKLGALSGDALWTNRVTYILDPAGVLRAIDTSVNVASHGEDIVMSVEALREE